jgi:hypothetical protein
MAKPQHGKPKKDAEKRARAYTVRYNEEEDGLVEASARAKSLEVASWIRMVSVEAARAQQAPDKKARP